MMNTALVRSLLGRAERLLLELSALYEPWPLEDIVEAQNLFHEICEKCLNSLDQLMRLAWTVRLAERLGNPLVTNGYFPRARTEHEYRTALGRWHAADLARLDPAFDTALRRWQPMSVEGEHWLLKLRDVAGNKHVRLLPMEPSGGETFFEFGIEDGDGFSASFGISTPAMLIVETIDYDARMVALRFIRACQWVVQHMSEQLELP